MKSGEIKVENDYLNDRDRVSNKFNPPKLKN